MNQFKVDPAVPPADWQAAFRKMEALIAVLVANLGQQDARIEALENRLGTALPATMRVTEVVLKVEP